MIYARVGEKAPRSAPSYRGARGEGGLGVRVQGVGASMDCGKNS